MGHYHQLLLRVVLYVTSVCVIKPTLALRVALLIRFTMMIITALGLSYLFMYFIYKECIHTELSIIGSSTLS